MEDMNVGQVFYDNFGDEDDPKSDFSLFQKICCFEHNEACEFIVHLGDDLESLEYRVGIFKDRGFSQAFIDEVETAISMGFNYLCVYA